MKKNHSHPLPKTEKLRAVQAKLDKMLAKPDCLDNPEADKLIGDIEAFKSSFLLYQGQEIDATLVNYISGDFTTSTVDHDGDEKLYRDAQGRYYLRRKLNWLEVNDDVPRQNRPASGRTLVHRLSSTAAILWATTRLNSETLDLRSDAADLLRQKPSNKTDLAAVGWLDAHARKLVSERLAEKPGLDPRDLFNGALEFLLGDPEAGATEYCCTSSGCLEAARTRRLEAQGNEGAAGGKIPNVPLLVEVPQDFPDRARKLGYSAAEYLWLLAENACANPPPFIEIVEQGGEPAEVDAGSLPEIVGATGTADDGHLFTFDYPPTKQRIGIRRTIKVDAGQMARLEELAAIFELAPAQFLRGAVDKDLPGQPHWQEDNRLRGLLKAEHLAFACFDEAMTRRIERAAQSRSQTVDEYVAEAVGDDVGMWEEPMLVHPKTGELLEADYEDLFTTSREEMTAAPLGLENAPEFQMYPGRKYVRFNAYLTPEQLERLEYPDMICEANKDVPVLIVPFDEDGSPYLEVGGRRIQIGHTFPPAAAEEAA